MLSSAQASYDANTGVITLQFPRSDVGSPSELYALQGVRRGARLSKVKRRLHLGRGITIGANTWYVVPDGPARGVLKVRRGVVEEIGIANPQLTASPRAVLRFLRTFR